MSANSNAAPVIIKKKKNVVGGGHHGGAWKVAYADFVTAMMAFFLLMWLLNATTEKQRKGIADYFNPTIPINRVSGGGTGAFGGDSVFTEDTMAQNGAGASSLHPTARNQASGHEDAGLRGARDSDESAKLAEVQEALIGATGESDVHPEMFKHIVTRVTDEGLVIELFDTEEVSLFHTLDDEPTAMMEEIASMLVRVTSIVKNPVAIEAYVASRPVVVAENPVWTLSSERAEATRKLLEQQKFAPERVSRVTGHADREPADRIDPLSVRNNRLEIILLRTRPR